VPANPTLINTGPKRLLILGLSLVVPLVCAAAPAHAHFLWARVEAGSPPSLSIYFSEEPADRTTAVPLSRLSSAQARDAAGRDLRLAAGSSFLSATLPADANVAVATQSWGVVDRSEDGTGAFLLEYYAKAAASLTATTHATGIRYETFAVLRAGRLVVSVRGDSGPARAAGVRLHLPSGSTVDGVTDELGEAAFDLREAGVYGARARIVEARSGVDAGKPYREVRHYSTLVFPVSPVEASSGAGLPAPAVAESAPVDAPANADPAAYALLKKAHDSRQVMPAGFPGFRCLLDFRDDDRAFSGRLVYRRQGEMTIDVPGVGPEGVEWLKGQLQNLIGHRRGGDFASGDGRYPLKLDPEDGNSYGRLIVVNDWMKSEYRVRDDRVLEVTRTQDGMRFTISVIEAFDTAFGKYIANHFLVSYRDAASGVLKKVEGYRDSHARVDDVYLPTSRTVLTVETGSPSPRVRSIKLREIRRLEAATTNMTPVAQPLAGTRPAMSVTESVTVVATGRPEPVRDTAVPVTIIDEETVVRELMSDIRDLVRWAPGVYAENSATRFGLSGVNIRGIGGNRVQTQVDGVRTAEQFDFGPFGITQYSLDPEALKTVEIVRSAGSALYGSDALGGVVSFATRDPRDYLSTFGNDLYVGAKAGYDDRRNELAESLSFALGNETIQASAFVSRRDGGEVENQGDVESADFTRTAPNPQKRTATSILAKVAATPAAGQELKLTAERFDASARTDVLTSQGTTTTGSTRTTVSDVEGFDEQDRTRVSLDYVWAPAAGALDRLAARAFYQNDESRQSTSENRLSVSPSRTTEVRRDGALTFEQRSIGGELRLSKMVRTGQVKHALTLGGSLRVDTFDQLRLRTDMNVVTGASVPSSPLVFPSKYFPRSDVTNVAAFIQDSIAFQGDRIRVTPGVRFDRFRLDADQNDPVYLSGNAGIDPPVDMDDTAISPRIGAVVRVTSPFSAYGQYARGFRAPPFSYVNNGFTNVASGYTTLPNGNLRPELSDNFELGLRGTFKGADFSAGVFDNRYSDFIEITSVGVNPSTGLLEFQPRNVTDVRIRGFELAGSAALSSTFTANVSFAVLDGENRSSGLPLNSIPPTKLVAGVRWHPSRPFGGELIGTFVGARDDVDTSVTDQVRTPGYGLLDVTFFYDISTRFSLQAAVFNVFDRTYLAWADVQGITASSPVLDRYTSPGRSVSAAIRFRM
jgi:hemoglobin/transferrin/lactoferrin receptor protein